MTRTHRESMAIFFGEPVLARQPGSSDGSLRMVVGAGRRAAAGVFGW